MKINWDVFNENSSSRDAIFEFAIGLHSFPALKGLMWDKRAKIEVGNLQRLGRKAALSRARAWCSRNGFDYKAYCPYCGRG